MNEKQVGIGESTCSGVFGTKAAGYGGRALMSLDTLSQLAMGRASSSREAVKLMGAMAEKYGFYGAGSFEGSAESLMVTDPQEGFIFHILPDPTGESAIWAAQRVPDDHIAVVPNVFVIRALNLTDGFNYLASASVHEVAQARGWWKPSDGLLDFTQVYSDGEYAHKYYSGRRVWGVYQLLAPSLGLKPEYGEWRRDAPYPTTARPDKKVDVASVAGAMRSYCKRSLGARTTEDPQPCSPSLPLSRVRPAVDRRGHQVRPDSRTRGGPLGHAGPRGGRQRGRQGARQLGENDWALPHVRLVHRPVALVASGLGRGGALVGTPRGAVHGVPAVRRRHGRTATVHVGHPGRAREGHPLLGRALPLQLRAAQAQPHDRVDQRAAGGVAPAFARSPGGPRPEGGRGDGERHLRRLRRQRARGARGYVADGRRSDVQVCRWLCATCHDSDPGVPTLPEPPDASPFGSASRPR